MKTCTRDDCAKKHLARGFCSTHYNQEHQPNRHKTVTVPCGWCEKPCQKEPTRAKRYSAVFCGYECRDDMRAYAKDPAHPRLLSKVSTASRELVLYVHPPHAAREAQKLQRPPWVAGRCADCDQPFVHTWLGASSSRYCSAECLRRANRRGYKARQRGSQGTFTWTEFMRIFLLFDRRCAYCGITVEGQPEPDHVIPLARRGHNFIGNILPSCRECNADKRDVPLNEWNSDRTRRGLPSRCTTWAQGDPRYAHLTAQPIGHAA